MNRRIASSAVAALIACTVNTNSSFAQAETVAERAAASPPVIPPATVPLALSETDSVLTLSVRDALARVKAAHPRLREQRALIGQSDIDARRARLARLRITSAIQAGYSGNGFGLGTIATSSEPSSPSMWAHGATAQIYADARLPLYAGGAIDGGIDSATARQDAAHADERVTALVLQQLLLSAYARVVASQQLERVADDGKARAEQIQALAERRRAIGVGSEADVARAHLNLLQRENTRVSALNDVRIAENELRGALALGSNVQIALVEPIEAFATLGSSRAPESQHQSPDVLAARARKRSAAADTQVATAQLRPRIELFANAQYGAGSINTVGNASRGISFTPTANPDAGPIPPLSGVVATGATFTLLAFDRFLTRDQARAAEQRESAASAQLEETERRVNEATSVANSRQTRATESLAVFDKSMHVADDAVHFATARYEVGNASLTDVLQTELERLDLLTQRVRTQLELAIARIDWLRATGTLL